MMMGGWDIELNCIQLGSKQAIKALVDMVRCSYKVVAFFVGLSDSVVASTIDAAATIIDVALPDIMISLNLSTKQWVIIVPSLRTVHTLKNTGHPQL